MESVKPADVASAMVNAGRTKLQLYITHKARGGASAPLTAPTHVPTE